MTTITMMAAIMKDFHREGYVYVDPKDASDVESELRWNKIGYVREDTDDGRYVLFRKRLV